MRRDNKGGIFSEALSLAQHIEPANLISSEQDFCHQYQTSVPHLSAISQTSVPSIRLLSSVSPNDC